MIDPGNGIAPAGWSRDRRLKVKPQGDSNEDDQTWSGKVVDAACKDQAAAPAPAPSAQSAQPGGQVANACEPTASTVAFGIELSDGRVLKLDSAGNTKAAEAMKTNAGKSSLQATVTGSLDGQTVKVETIEIK